MESKKALVYSIIVASVFATSSANAAGWQMPTNPGGLPEDFMGSIGKVTNWLLELVIALTVLVIIYGGAVYVGSTGDNERVTSAKKTIKYAIMGLAMAGIAYAVVNVIITKVLTA